MANYPRSLIVFDGDIFHVTWKCHNDEWLLSSEFSKRLYYELLVKYKDAYGLEFYSYCFMDNHPHLTGRCVTQKQMSDFFRVVNSCFAKKMNQFLKRKGQMVMDRFKSPTMDNQNDLLSVIIYNDLNPSRTVKGIHPKDFKWSSYRHYAYGKKDALLTHPGCYKMLGKTDKERQKKYREMIQEIFQNDERVLKKCPYRKESGKILFFIGDPVKIQVKYENLQKHYQEKKTKLKDRFRIKPPPQNNAA